MISSPDTDQIAPALIAALNQMRSVVAGETATVPTKAGNSYSYSYASLPQVTEMARSVFAEHDLAIHQSVSENANGSKITVVTRIWHSSGQWIESDPTPMPAAGGAQDVGSSITYGRRYSLMAILGIATTDDDDDGKRAQEAKEKADAPHPLSGRVTALTPKLRKLSDGNKAEIQQRANGRSLKPSELLADEQWLATIEEWVDELSQAGS